MLINKLTNPYKISNGKLSVCLNHSGDVDTIMVGDIMVNLFGACCINGSVSNIYLRDRLNNKQWALMGINSCSSVSIGDASICYTGNADGVEYTLTLQLNTENLLSYNLQLQGAKDELDVLFVQDVGIASVGAIKSNELYTSQYIDHTILSNKYGYTVTSRQNMSQGGRNPALFSGAYGIKTVGYCTDLFDLYGTQYKVTGKMANIANDLPNRKYQYEMSAVCLATEKFNINKNIAFSFYQYYNDNQVSATTQLSYWNEVNELLKKNTVPKCNTKLDIVRNNVYSGTISGNELNVEQIKKYYKDILLPEYQDNKVLSFFDTNYSHISTLTKEKLQQRPTGNIITTANIGDNIDKNLLTSTNYAYGQFNSQMVVGNTSMNKLTSVNRGLLNINKTSGLRIYILNDGKYYQLSVASLYEMGVNYSKWIYSFNDETIEVVAFMQFDNQQYKLEVKSTNPKRKFLITSQIIMASNEFENDYVMTDEGAYLAFTFAENTFQYSKYNKLKYMLQINGNVVKSDETTLLTKPVNSLLVHNIQGNFSIDISASINGDCEFKLMKFETEDAKYKGFYSSYSNGISIQTNDINYSHKLNATIKWFTHNAMVHYCVPHGLEQTGGAAWGARDVCQGPIEMFFAYGRFKQARNTILDIFKYQENSTYEWPQWFMFDNYDFAAGDCHGDIIFWPVKVVGDYLALTKDISLLSEQVPFRQGINGSILQHLEKAFEAITHRLIMPYDLISYAGGDWDDTLQPANSDMKQRLVSSWTQALAFQSLYVLAQQLKNTQYNDFAVKLDNLANRLQKAFTKYCIKDGIIAGFVYCNSNNTLDYLLHPSDKKSGVSYRLLPMTRSIIASMVTKQQANLNVQCINENLIFNDGVRLMNVPVKYSGGVSTMFMRAEQASNVGREISLMYTHAHIRYIEAMAKIGESDKLLYALNAVSPVNYCQATVNAALRQSNAYFSSSEGDFADRYDYQQNFNLLKEGKIATRGGWRIYSSGSGIFINQLISNLFGIRLNNDSIEIDPVLPVEFNQTKLNITVNGIKLTFNYYLGKQKHGVKTISVNNNQLKITKQDNPYRKGGATVLLSQLNDNDIVGIFTY